MENERAAQAFATLGHPGRLAVWRLLLRFAPQGVRPTEMAEALGMKPNTLSHHLADLTASGLATVRRAGRSLFYAADLGAAMGMIGYLAFDAGRARPDLLPVPPPDASTGRPLNVLFVCSGNSARSILAEALLNDLGEGRFRAFSAGTRPRSAPDPMALDLLRRKGLETTGLRAKHIAEFQAQGAPRMDLVVTVCDGAAAEDGPPWPGQPIAAHWPVPDPVRATGTDATRGGAFAAAFGLLRHRIGLLVATPVEGLDRLALQARMDRIGTMNDED